jgi:hypothetical protein
MKVVAKKNKFINRRGTKKLKILTAGKVYNIEEIDVRYNIIHGYKVICELGWTFWYSSTEFKNLFITLQSSRSKKINTLGI